MTSNVPPHPIPGPHFTMGPASLPTEDDKPILKNSYSHFSQSNAIMINLLILQYLSTGDKLYDSKVTITTIFNEEKTWHFPGMVWLVVTLPTPFCLPMGPFSPTDSLRLSAPGSSCNRLPQFPLHFLVRKGLENYKSNPQRVAWTIGEGYHHWLRTMDVCSKIRAKWAPARQLLSRRVTSCIVHGYSKAELRSFPSQ